MQKAELIEITVGGVRNERVFTVNLPIRVEGLEVPTVVEKGVFKSLVAAMAVAAHYAKRVTVEFPDDFDV